MQVAGHTAVVAEFLTEARQAGYASVTLAEAGLKQWHARNEAVYVYLCFFFVLLLIIICSYLALSQLRLCRPPPPLSFDHYQIIDNRI